MGIAAQILDFVAPRITESLPGVAVVPSTQDPGTAPGRAGYDSDVPWGGASRMQPGGDYPGGRSSFMTSLYSCYVGCPWLSAPIDVIARTVTAGGVRIEPDEDGAPGDTVAKPPRKVAALQQLLDFCNPTQDIVQLLRGVLTNLGIYGDGFLEVQWLLGLPVALYDLDPATMTVCTDEHGAVTGYDQVVGAREPVHFEPDQIIHVSADAPRGSLYGMGTAQKALLPVTIWLFTSGLLNETMRQGDPPKVHWDFPLEVPQNEVRGWRGNYRNQNLGAKNIGVPTTTRGGVTATELQKGRLADYLQIQDSCRDTIISVAGVPPAKVGIIESGNLGGGTGSSQDKTFQVNTCGPAAAILLEKLNYHLTRRAFGITDWSIRFVDVDTRDDTAVENIRDLRIRNGAWTLNDLLTDLGKPTIGPDGDVHLLVTAKEILTWDQVAAYAEAAVQAVVAKTNATTATADAALKHADAAKTAAANGVAPVPPGAPPQGPPAGSPPTPPAGEQPDENPTESVKWRARVTELYQRHITGGDRR